MGSTENTNKERETQFIELFRSSALFSKVRCGLLHGTPETFPIEDTDISKLFWTLLFNAGTFTLLAVVPLSCNSFTRFFYMKVFPWSVAWTVILTNFSFQFFKFLKHLSSPSFCVVLNNTNITKRCLPKLFISVKITMLANHVVHKRQKNCVQCPPARCHSAIEISGLLNWTMTADLMCHYQPPVNSTDITYVQGNPS